MTLNELTSSVRLTDLNAKPHREARLVILHDRVALYEMGPGEDFSPGQTPIATFEKSTAGIRAATAWAAKHNADITNRVWEA